MLDGTVFIVCSLLQGSQITARAIRYSDPEKGSSYGGVFSFSDSEGTTSYVQWAAIKLLVIHNLATADAPIPPAAQAQIEEGEKS
jgi:hypothetical protein